MYPAVVFLSAIFVFFFVCKENNHVLLQHVAFYSLTISEKKLSALPNTLRLTCINNPGLAFFVFFLRSVYETLTNAKAILAEMLQHASTREEAIAVTVLKDFKVITAK